jgi:acetylornithine deacetylase/succinyl-diaminopimelate desuccinylase-like protein
MSIDAIDLTRKLVNIESISYHEGLAGAFLADFLTAEQYAVERMPVEQPDIALTPGGGMGERFNVYAAMPGVTPDVVLSSHMDTVPPFFGCTEDDEFLYGRGTCDAKGIIAAQVAAVDLSYILDGLAKKMFQLIGHALKKDWAIRRGGPGAIIVLDVDGDMEPCGGVLPWFKLKLIGFNSVLHG